MEKCFCTARCQRITVNSMTLIFLENAELIIENARKGSPVWPTRNTQSKPRILCFLVRWWCLFFLLYTVLSCSNMFSLSIEMFVSFALHYQLEKKSLYKIKIRIIAPKKISYISERVKRYSVLIAEHFHLQKVKTTFKNFSNKLPNKVIINVKLICNDATVDCGA